MDPNTTPPQNIQNQNNSDGSDNAAQSNATSAGDELAQIATQAKKPAVQKPNTQQISGGGGIEEGASVMIAENSDADEDDEDELSVAPQEKKNLGVMGQGDSEEQDDKQQIAGQSIVADAQETETVPGMRPAVPEFAPSPEIEKIVEKAPNTEPVLSQEMQDIGVTHSGPGVIDVLQANTAPSKIPVSYDTAVVQEKLTKMHDSKHWLMGKIVYLWRKLNPNITVKKTVAKKAAPVNVNQSGQQRTENPVS